MALLVTGISGFLGTYMARLLAERGVSYTGTYYLHQPRGPAMMMDLTDKEDILRGLGKIKPSAVLHLAAASNPNWCEVHPQEAHFVNVDASVTLASYCNARGIPFIYTSTDLVFDGQNAPYAEDWAPSPICTYGSQKLAAEQGVQLMHPDATIARLPLLYGWGRNFLTDWAKKLQAGHIVQAFTDEFRSPACAEDVAAGMLLLLEKQASGIFHLGGPERMSRFEMALAIACALEVDGRLVLPSRQTEAVLPAPRPSDVSLSSEKAFQLGYQPRELQEVLPQVLAEAEKGSN